MRNERRMSGSARGDEKPTAEKRYGAHRLLNHFMRLSNSATIRNSGTSLSSSRGGVIALSFALLLMKHESLESVRRCLVFERNVSALVLCSCPQISLATGPSQVRCAKSSRVIPI